MCSTPSPRARRRPVRQQRSQAAPGVQSEPASPGIGTFRIESFFSGRLRPTHKVRTYKEYHSVCLLIGIGTLPTPLSRASVPLPPEPRGGHTRLRVRGWGSPNSDDWRKSLSLCLLCGPTFICNTSVLFCYFQSLKTLTEYILLGAHELRARRTMCKSVFFSKI